MHLHLHFFVFLFLLYQAFAAPTPRTQRKGRSFKVDRVRRGDYVPHGPAALGKAYRKFNIEQIIFDDALADFEPIKLNHTKPSTNQKITDPDRSGTVSAASVQSDAEFVSPVVIGGQKIIMDFDTGSSNL